MCWELANFLEQAQGSGHSNLKYKLDLLVVCKILLISLLVSDQWSHLTMYVCYAVHPI